jgi:hypothetical protein
VTPGIGRIWKAVQEEDEWTLTLLEIGEFEPVRAYAVHKALLTESSAAVST